MKKYNFGIIGCGNMASAILNALKSDTVTYLLKQNGIKLNLKVSDRDTDMLDAVRCPAVQTTTDNNELAAGSDFVLLAIKPQVAAQALRGIDFNGKVVLSIMAGINLDKLSELIAGSTTKLVRVMPNLNAKTGMSVNAYCVSGITDEEEEVVVNVLGSFGKYFKIKERQMNAITGVSGSGPAFVFMFINAFMEKAVSCGFSPDTAKEIVLQTMRGCADTVENYGGKLSELVDSVCSKGGTTIEGVNYLKSNRFEEAVKEAITRSEKRSEELEKTL